MSEHRSKTAHFRLPVTVQKVEMRADRSVAVHVRTTQEIPEPQFVELHKAFQRIGWFIFSENEIDEQDVPKENAPSDTKSRTQRLFNSLFVLWKLEAEAEGEQFDDFRNRNMDVLIEFVKDQIRDTEDRLGKR